MNTETAVATTQQETKAPVAIGNRGLSLASLDDLWRFSAYVEKSGLAPKGIQTKEAIFVAVQMGMELGLTPMAALQNIAVINGRPTIWGDAQLGVVRSTGQLESFAEWYEQDGKKMVRNPEKFSDTTSAVCRVKRFGYDVSEASFSVSDAKLAGLWGKQGPWAQYPARMLRMRARSFILRDQFGDALRGMMSTEEFRDASPAIEVETETVTDEPTRQAENTPPPPGPQTDPREELASLVTGQGFTWEHMARWIRDSGQPAADADMTGFQDVPVDTATRWLRARAGLLRQLTAIVRGEGGAK